MLEKNCQVALVLDRNFGEGLIPLSELMPVWIIDSLQNRAVVEKIRNTGSSGTARLVTTFPARELEPLEMTCERILQSLDEHHNDCSQTPGYSELNVIGVSLGEVSLKPFLELNFDQFLRTDKGFNAKKDSSDHGKEP